MNALAPLLVALTVLPTPNTAAEIGDSQKLLKGLETTEHFELHFRENSRAGAAVDRIAHLIEPEYARIVSTLGIRGMVEESEPFHLYLYDDLEELRTITGVSGTGGFSAGRESHMPWDNDQTRLHEVVHIVVAAMESTGDEERSLFFAEGIANAVLQFVHGIPVHSVAAYEKRRGSLPSLTDLTSHPDFYAFLGENPGLNAYDVAGSYFLFLLENYSPKKVMSYYHGKPIKKALGKSLARIEKDWHEHLDEFPVRPALLTLLQQRRGDGGEFSHVLSVEERLGPDLLGEPDQWRSLLSELRAVDEVGTWELGEDGATAKNDSGGDWTIAMAEGSKVGDCVLRAKVQTQGSCWGVKLRYGQSARLMVLGMGAFIYGPGGAAASTSAYKLGDQEVDLVLHIAGGRAKGYVNGDLLLETDVPADKVEVGVGLVGGGAKFTSVSVREL